MNSGAQTAWQVLLLLQLTGAHQPSHGRPAGPWPELGPLVRAGAGAVRGRRASDGNYSMFLGIPYATVDPNNPFGPAVPHVFQGIFDAFDDSAQCPQIEEFNRTITGTLDCLHLNIYVPNSASPQNPLPVLVIILGGSFKSGFSSRYLYGPRFLVRCDIILVTFNYRVCPYGFMCLDTPEVPGNQGLKDQVKALRWIKDNIRSFGGDESRITIGGNSAGGICVDLLTHFLHEQLFNRIILQSGVAKFYDLIRKSNPEAPLKLARELNYTATDINDALTYLSGMHPHQIIGATKALGLSFGPCVEKQFDRVDQFITKHPVNVNGVKNVDVLIGITNEEAYAALYIMDKYKFESVDFVSYVLNETFEYRDKKLFAQIEEILTHFYYGDAARSALNRRPGINVQSDFYANHPTMRTVQKYINSGIKNMYLYMFSYTGQRNYMKHKMKVPYTEGGATHADELGYLFDISYMKNFTHPKDMLTVDRITELWTNFVKFGNPTAAASGWSGPRWPRVTRARLPYMEIGECLRRRRRPMRQRMALLDLLFLTAGQYERGLL